jgi:hypothetical protein
MRVTILVPLYTPLSMRVAKRFFFKYGFKLVFMFAFSLYFWNVWSESLSVRKPPSSCLAPCR